MALGASGNIYITGSTVTLDSASGATNLLVGKIDSTTYTATWTKGWGGSDGDEVGLDIKVSSDEGYVFVAGYSNKFKCQYETSGACVRFQTMLAASPTVYNLVVMKFQASDGTHLWSATIGGTETGEFSSVDLPNDASYVY
jgi:hypothetical protein